MRRASATQLVSPLERLSHLHTVPLLSKLGAGELMTIAKQCREMSFRPGQRLVGTDAPPDDIHFIVSGQAAMFENGRIIRRLDEDDSVGLLTVLARRQEPLESVAMSSLRTLAISSVLVREILVDRFSVYHALLRSLCSLLRAERTLALSTLAKRIKPAESGSANVDGLLGRILLLERALSFGSHHPLAISQMAKRASVVSLRAGELLWEPGDEASGTYVVASAELEGNFAGLGFTIGAACACGFLDSIGDGQRTYELTAGDRPTTLLRIGHEALLDVFEDHVDLAEDCLASIASAVIDALGNRVMMTNRIPVGLQSAKERSRD